VQNLENWSRGEKVLTPLLEVLFSFKSMRWKEDWSMSENLQHYNDFTHTVCLCLFLLPMSNLFFLRGKIGKLSRHQINKPNCILPEIWNFFYHVPSYSSLFWCTWSKSIWEKIRLKLCALPWMPVSCCKESKILEPTYKVLNGFGRGKHGAVTSLPGPCHHIRKCGGPSRWVTVKNLLFWK